MKYSQDWNSATPYNCFKNFADPCGSGPNSGSAHLFAINDTQTFSPTLILTSTFGFTRGATLIDAYNSSLNSDPLGTLGFPSYLGTNGFLGVPAIASTTTIPPVTQASGRILTATTGRARTPAS